MLCYGDSIVKFSLTLRLIYIIIKIYSYVLFSFALVYITFNCTFRKPGT
jgi:hypothetical protein